MVGQEQIPTEEAKPEENSGATNLLEDWQDRCSTGVLERGMTHWGRIFGITLKSQSSHHCDLDRLLQQ